MADENKELRLFEERLDEFKSNMNKLGELETKIQASEDGASDLKEEVEKISLSNADLVDSMAKYKSEVGDRFDDLDALIQKQNREGKNAVDYVDPAEGLVKAVEESGLTPGMRGRADFHFPEWREKQISRPDGGFFATRVPPAILRPGERDLSVMDLIPSAQTSASSVEYLVESSVTDAAGPQVTEGSLKPESTFTFTPATAPVRTIAHWVTVPQQMLDDLTALRSYVSTRMRFLLEQEVEDEVLNGDGTLGTLLGINAQATVYDETLNAEASGTIQNADILRLAITQVALAEYAPTGIVLNPVDWASIELLKESDGGYLFAAPQSAASPRLWGLPVVSTTAQATDTFTVGAFQLGAQIWRRMQARVEISTEDSDNFRRNLATLLAETRLALTVYRPESFVSATFTGAVTP